MRAPSHPDLEWAASGAMALTGWADGPPLLAPAPVATVARTTLEELARNTRSTALAAIDGAALLGEHAATADLRRNGTTSIGGSCKLLPTADGWIAVNLARPDDVALVPAWLESPAGQDPWRTIAEEVRSRAADAVVERGRMLGLPVAPVRRPSRSASDWSRVVTHGRRHERNDSKPPLVVDLSSLWAGPLATHLLERAGARVVKVESTSRPDGARHGRPAFFALLNANKESVTLDFHSNEGRNALTRLLACADIVIEASRPRALRQLGVDAEKLVRERPGLVWLSITGYGRGEPEASWVAFGDDAAAAAGMTATDAAGRPVFCGDAIADPLAGLHAALAATTAWQQGGGVLLDVNLHDVTAHALSPRPQSMEPRGEVHRVTGNGWEVVVGSRRQTVLEPCARAVDAKVRPFGADTREVLAELTIPC